MLGELIQCFTKGYAEGRQSLLEAKLAEARADFHSLCVLLGKILTAEQKLEVEKWFDERTPSTP
jgi:hypothetical protein